MLHISFFPLFVLVSMFTSTHSVLETETYWAEVSKTVAEGDFEGYSALYHEDAILVNGRSGNSYPISTALAGWKKGFDDTKAGKMKAGVDFRFSKKLQSETTSHETGIFRYWSQLPGEEPTVFLANFEGLMVKKEGKWVMMMEYQISEASQKDWEALQ